MAEFKEFERTLQWFRAHDCALVVVSWVGEEHVCHTRKMVTSIVYGSLYYSIVESYQ